MGVARADEPLQMAQGPAAAGAGGFYVRVDGTYQSLDLSKVDRGHTHLVFAPGGPANLNAGPVAVFNPTSRGTAPMSPSAMSCRQACCLPASDRMCRIAFDASYVKATDL